MAAGIWCFHAWLVLYKVTKIAEKDTNFENTDLIILCTDVSKTLKILENNCDRKELIKTVVKGVLSLNQYCLLAAFHWKTRKLSAPGFLRNPTTSSVQKEGFMLLILFEETPHNRNYVASLPGLNTQQGLSCNFIQNKTAKKQSHLLDALHRVKTHYVHQVLAEVSTRTLRKYPLSKISVTCGHVDINNFYVRFETTSWLVHIWYKLQRIQQAVVHNNIVCQSS